LPAHGCSSHRQTQLQRLQGPGGLLSYECNTSVTSRPCNSSSASIFLVLVKAIDITSGGEQGFHRRSRVLEPLLSPFIILCTHCAFLLILSHSHSHHPFFHLACMHWCRIIEARITVRHVISRALRGFVMTAAYARHWRRSHYDVSTAKEEDRSR
jgi:hypothetical protein